MTNSQSPRVIDWIIGNLFFELSVDFVPKSNPDNILILLYICQVNLKSASLSYLAYLALTRYKDHIRIKSIFIRYRHKQLYRRSV